MDEQFRLRRTSSMDNRRAKRRRYNGGQYEQLHDDTDSLRSSIIRRRGNNDISSVLCDKCWSSHIRRQAQKRCLNCKKNLCTYCAKMDESRRRTWWPSLLLSCWRFIFLKAFRRHTIVDLEHVSSVPEQNDSSQGRMQSMSRNETPQSSLTRRDDRYERNQKYAERNAKAYNGKMPNLTRPERPRYHLPNAQPLYRAYSFDKHLNKRYAGGHIAQHLRRSRSAERLPNKFIDRESEFRKLYHQNWENEPFGFHRAHAGDNQKHTPVVSHNQATSNKETVQCGEQTSEVRGNNERRFKRGKTSRRGIKHVADIFPENKDAYVFTENQKPPVKETHFESTHDVPMKTGRHKYEKGCRNTQQHKTNTGIPKETAAAPPDDQHKQTETITPYIVEEPPDSCPVCLEIIPCRQARRLHCSHSIHTRCLINLLNKMEFDFGVKCPVCNQVTQIRNYYAARHLWYKELPIVVDH